jgi:hypothetical protein
LLFNNQPSSLKLLHIPPLLQNLFVWRIPPILAIINGIKGYGYGVWGWDKKKTSSSSSSNNNNTLVADLCKDFVDGIKSIVPTVLRRNNLPIRSGSDRVYAVGTVWIGVWTVIQTVHFVTGLASQELSPYQLYDGWTGVARFGLLSTIYYTLSDASSRDRLAGSTFIQLGRDLGLAFLVLASSMIITPKLGRVRIYQSVPLTAHGLFLLYNSIMSARANAKNNNKKTTMEKATA